jgi:phage tail sheath gpL-like
MPLPNTIRLPFIGVTFDPSRAFQGPSVLAYKCLLIGQRTSAGSKSELDLQPISSADQAKQYWGVGSVLHLMAIAWFANNKATRIYGIALDDEVGSTSGTKTLTVSGPATTDGVLYLYIAGRKIEVVITSGDTANTIATNINTALVAVQDKLPLPVTSGVAVNVVTLTERNKGTLGNDVDVRFNYNVGEATPAGVGVVIATGVTGAIDPLVQDVIDVLGEEWYQVIASPYADATNLTAVETELDDRFGPIRQIDGRYFTAKRDTLSNLVTFGNGRNSQHVVIGHSFGVPTTSWEVAATLAAIGAREGEIDPARPFTDLEMKGILSPAIADRFTLLENNSLLFEGITVWRVDESGRVRVARIITTYQRNASGGEDIAYLDLFTLQTLSYLRWDFRTRISNKYGRAKLADDGVFTPPGQQIITPSIGRAEAVAIFRGWQALALVENVDQFIADLVCVRNISDPNRLDWTLPPDLINGFLVGSVDIQFLLQSPSV